MDKIFNKEDVFTNITAENAKVGTVGFFGYGLQDLITAVKENDFHVLSDVDQTAHCFKASDNCWYILFLPLSKVLKQRKYRPFKSISELFGFLMPENEETDNLKMVEKLLGKKIILKNPENGQFKAMFIQNIEFNNDSSDINLNCLSLEYLFNIYKVLINDYWIPFGVEIKDE
jgi:hypothetical protein